MPLYAYNYIGGDGRAHKGLIDAFSEQEAKERLRLQKVLVTELRKEKATGGKHNLRGDDLLNFTLQLAQLIEAGLPVFESLSALEEQAREEKYHRVLMSLCDAIKGGSDLSQAMSEHPRSFDQLYCALVEAGESSGSLAHVLNKLGELLTKRMKLRKQMITALIYPGVIACFCLVVVVLLLTFAIPSIRTLFEGRELSGFTQVVLGVSSFLTSWWWIYLPLLATAIYGVGYWLTGPTGKEAVQDWAVRVPIVRKLVVQRALARFCQTLATLQEGGLNTIDSLRLAKKVVGNRKLEWMLEKAEERIVEGSSLSKELRGQPLIPALVPRMLAVGEESGDPVPMLKRIGQLYEQELEKTLSRITTLAQPVILIVMGAIVGVIMLAVLLPLTNVEALF